MGRIDDRLSELGLSFRKPFAAAAGGRVQVRPRPRRAATLAYVSGHVPIDGAEVADDRQGRRRRERRAGLGGGARSPALSILASLKQELGDLDAVQGWIKALGLVNCAPGFDKPAGRDQRLQRSGRSSCGARPAATPARRSAPRELPFDVPVEVEAIVEIA